MAGSRTTYLSLVAACDSYPYTQGHEESFYKLKLPCDDCPHGYMLPDIVTKMPWTSKFTIDHQSRTVQVLDTSNGRDISTACTNSFSELVSICIDQNIFKSISGRHSEPYAIVGARYPVSIERFAASLFGIAARGAHMTAYTKNTEGLRIWVPRRSAHLFTYPNMLDTSVAGGVPAGETPFENMVREAGEEASLDETFVTKNTRSVGAITYMATSSGKGFDAEHGLIVPDIIYVFDLELPEDMTPKPRDDEVKEFYLMSVEEIKEAMLKEQFKPNCALVMLDFFIRHGIVTADNEPDFVEIQSRMHRRLPFRTSSHVK